MTLFLKAILGLDGSGYEIGIKRAQSLTDKFVKSTSSSLNSKLSGLFTAAIAEEAIRRTIAFGGEVNDLSERLGVSTDALQQWNYAAEQTGSNADKVAGFFEKIAEFREKVRKGDSNALLAAKQFGLKPSELMGMRNEDVGLHIGNMVKNGDVQQFTAALKEVGGKGATSLVAAFKGGLQELFNDAPLIKMEEIVKLDALGDAFVTLGKRIMVALSPAITSIAEKFFQITDHIKGIGAYFGARSGGASPKDAYKAMFGAEEESKNEREAAVAAAIKAAAERGGVSAPLASVKKPDKIFTMETGRNEPTSLNINSLQQIGARVGFSAMQSMVQKNIAALDRNSAIIERNNKIDEARYRRNKWVPGMDGGSNDMGVKY